MHFNVFLQRTFLDNVSKHIRSIMVITVAHSQRMCVQLNQQIVTDLQKSGLTTFGISTDIPRTPQDSPITQKREIYLPTAS